LIAGPETQWYRTQKFVKRNKIPVAVAAVMFLLLASMLAVTVSLLRVNGQRRELLAREVDRLAEQKRLAEQQQAAERDRAEMEQRKSATEEAAARIIIDMASNVKDPKERERLLQIAFSQLPLMPSGARDPGIISAMLRMGSDLLPKGAIPKFGATVSPTQRATTATSPTQ